MSVLRAWGVFAMAAFLLAPGALLGILPNEALAIDASAGTSSTDSMTSTTTTLDSPSSGIDDPGHGLKLQIGALYRFAHTVEDDKLNHLLTADLSLVSGSRLKSTWGIGAHLAIDDLGHRFGVKGIWRTPLGGGGTKYLQVAPGIYLFSEDESFEPVMPGYFLEVEMGIWREASVVIAGEFLPYKDRLKVWYSEPPPGAELYDSGTSTSFYAGAQVAQWWAVAAVGVAAIVVAAGTIENPWD